MKKSTILIIIVIVLIGGAVFFFFQGNSTPADEGSLSVENNPEVQASAARVLALLNQIKSLKIDPALFTSPEFQTLRDYSVPIPELEVGKRPNPFAPLPGSIVRPTATPSPSPRPSTTPRR
ncbi:MAG: hypothetical protein V4481_05595 [Patescibacteria group bacterium]